MTSSTRIHTYPPFRDIVEELRKLHLLNSHLNLDFSENSGNVGDEQGEMFHQIIKEMEKRYRGEWNVNMLPR